MERIEWISKGEGVGIRVDLVMFRKTYMVDLRKT